jgi:hypothetical protein
LLEAIALELLAWAAPSSREKNYVVAFGLLQLESPLIAGQKR